MTALRTAPLLLLLAAASLAAGFSLPNLPGGLPLSAFFALCEDSGQSEDIGPCLATLLGGAIDAARPNFTTGLEIDGDNVVLEPLKLDDIDPKRDKAFQVSVEDLKVHGISTLSINDISFNAENLALNLSFTNVTATGNVKLKYLFFTASPRVHLELNGLTVLVSASWRFDINPNDPERLDIVLYDAATNFVIGDLKADFEELGSIGAFLRSIINANSKTLVKFLVPGLERSVTKKLNRKLNRIKIAD